MNNIIESCVNTLIENKLMEIPKNEIKKGNTYTTDKENVTILKLIISNCSIVDVVLCIAEMCDRSKRIRGFEDIKSVYTPDYSSFHIEFTI